MVKIALAAVGIFFLSTGALYSQECLTSATKKTQTQALDTNQDGKPDVTYYHDGEFVYKADADTNYDGQVDITVYAKDGKFESADVDTDYDGVTDKSFSDVKEFNEWLNKNRPEFQDDLGWSEWQVTLFKF